MSRRFSQPGWRPLLLAAGSFLACGGASANYFYTQFATSSGPYAPIVQKFDVTSLPNSTIDFYISASAPAQMAPGDSFLALVSEIRAAADVWNHIPTATLKLQYGGLYQPGTAANAPGIFIEFSDAIPAGLLAISQPTSRASLKNADDGTQFYPILQSRMRLPMDMSQLPSYSELLFTTLVHEFGHTVGLQHTITSSVMATSATSGASRANPMAADDIAGFSWLYPTADFANQTGSVSGTVTDGSGNGVNLASVAVIAPGMDAGSAFPNPDGTFVIRGIPPGSYFLYVQPLPPALQGQTTLDGIVYPVARDGKTAIPPSQFFAGQFFPGTQSPGAATPVAVAAGQNVGGFRFQVRYVGAPAVSNIRSYGFVPDGLAVTAPPIVAGTTLPVEVAGQGLVSNDAVTPGLQLLSLDPLTQIVPSSLSAYPPPNPYGYIYASLNISAQETLGPGHLAFETPGDLYVLPAAFHVVSAPPPRITGITPFTSRILAIRGENLSKNTRVFFDGVEAVQRVFTENGFLIVSAPSAPGGYRANVVALNPDGQSSLFVGGPVVYPYNNSIAPTILVSPAFLAPGSTTTVDVRGINTDFVDGQTMAGFGTSDAMVTNIVVDGPTHLMITVSTSGNASIQTAQAINITNGLEVLAAPLGTSVGLQ